MKKLSEILPQSSVGSKQAVAILPAVKEKSQLIVSRFATTPIDLLTRFNPSTQIGALKCEPAMFQPDKYPRIADVVNVFGNEVAVDIIQAQIYSLMDSNAVQTASGREQALRYASEMLASRAKHWQISELIVFFGKYANGDFGEVPKTFSQSQFMAKVKQFEEYRMMMRDKAYRDIVEKRKVFEFETKRSIWLELSKQGKVDFDEFEKKCQEVLNKG